MTDYEIWHDEYKGSDKENEYWHGILIIPVHKKAKIVSLLKKIRDEHGINHDEDIKFAGILKKGGKKGKLLKNNLDLSRHILITKGKKASTALFNRNNLDIRSKDAEPFLNLRGIYGCKLILLHVPGNHKKLNKYPLSYSERVETTFRMALKGGIHSLFSSEEEINISGFFFDGWEHHKRHINLSRIIKGEFRDYCNIDDRGMKDRKDESKIIMSFVDNIIGGWSAILTNKQDSQEILFSLKGLKERLKSKEIFKNINGRWYKSLFVSKLEVIEEQIKFPDFFQNKNQMKLF